ncbi:enoyl-CoA hydratase/isomerase family protein [Nonomuraea turkmeniaca]|uniref:Enoyl-CoA hydratase/isomerase family protein n=1 Tax=Nonomuraea turkmeniaca TaxID=103838 RepID=A0A5S4FJX1_9ACTN|nr:enoyl-CoA-hydratase DpgB [Nonomuraea turkmeniaca]TMR20511.1 enoyl-CoA hydratase/isomerase family protein [Nonomuraea turkmeniaca]
MGTGNRFVLRVDGARPLSASSVEAVAAICDQAEDHDGPGVVEMHLSGAPEGRWTGELTVGLVTKWERVVRRLERLPLMTVAVVSGDCGGTALDVLLVADLRIAAPGTRLLVPSDGTATWPGMALYRLVQQTGPAAARRAVLLGAPIEADQAVALHLLDEIVHDPAGHAAALAGPAGPNADRELAIRRQLMFEAASTSFEDALGAHLAACDRALRGGAGAVS